MALIHAGLDNLESLTDPSLGEVITRHRSSWVCRVPLATAGEIFVKTYDYPTWRDIARGLLRTTWLAAGRARREAAAFAWMAQHGFPHPDAWLVAERRQFGLLRRAVLVSSAVPGEALHGLLPRLPPGDQEEVLAVLEGWVRALHLQGFRDRNLDLRNILAEQTDEGWRLTKIDSPRWRQRPPGSAPDPLTRADWSRLQLSIDALDLPGARRPLRAARNSEI